MGCIFSRCFLLDREVESSSRTTEGSSTSTENIHDAWLGCDFEVFLNFCGRDTRGNLTDYLYYSLVKAGIHTFRDEEELPKGEKIERLLLAIEQSKISIPIFSKNYASREWCLHELAKMVECKKNSNQKIFPIFYDVDPSVVREQSGCYNEAFLKHKKNFKQEDVQKWKEALREVGSYCGWVLKENFNGHQGRLVDEVVSEVLKELKKAKSVIPEEQLLLHGIEGSAFKENAEKILAGLIEDGARIGIYGTGGVGKTTLAMNIHDNLHKVQGKLNGVYWVTISQDFSIYNLQYKIAKAIGVELSSEDDEILRAAELSAAFLKKGAFALFLDDVWSYFPLEKVGISDALKGCRLILTSRFLNVCRRMGCSNKTIIKVDPLPELEAWDLFKERNGFEVVLSPEINQIARSITRECAGLPLAIITIASSLRGVEEVHEWRDTLERLKGSKEGLESMDDEVFPKLRLSYDRLKDSQVQQCFLYSAVYPEDHEIKRDDLINLIIDVGLINEPSRQAELDRGDTILNKLENACLLVEVASYGAKRVKMHDLIRDMALRISRSKFMVKSGRSLRELPLEEKWECGLEVVSLMYNPISKMSISPQCPKLSTLLLNNIYSILKISDCFFEYMPGLRVLDLSHTSIRELPNSVANMVNLNALILHSCNNLKRIPSIAKLLELRRLDLHDTLLRGVPNGILNLVNLKYLNLFYENGLKKVPVGMLAKLSSLRHLEIGWPKGDIEALEKGELARLEKLHYFCGFFEDWNAYKAFAKYFVKANCYKIVLGSPDDKYDSPEEGVDRFFKIDCSFIAREESIVMPENAEEISLHNWRDTLQTWSFEDVELVTPKLSPSQTFSHLKVLSIFNCDWIKVLTPFLLPNLQNLEKLVVSKCVEVQEIIVADEGEDRGTLILPKLRYLRLRRLPALERISEKLLVCDSLQELKIEWCPKLKSIPISLKCVNGMLHPPPSLFHITISDLTYEGAQQSWETLEWEHPDAKKALEPFVRLENLLRGDYISLSGYNEYLRRKDLANYDRVK